MAGTLAPPRQASAATTSIQTLTPVDVSALRLPFGHNERALQQTISDYPGRSVWVPETLEYVVLTPWRNRREIASVDELASSRNTNELLQAALERCIESGDDLLVAIELESRLGFSRYERAGFQLLEEVITYETNVWQRAESAYRGLRLSPVRSGDARADVVLQIDQAAFPWLWRNSREELDAYLASPGTAVYLVEEEGEPVAYVGATPFSGWAHIDRIAVTPAKQRQGLGWKSLSLAIDDLRRKGARRIALSTQRTNLRSQRLYERFGFWRTPELDYLIFGAWCREDLGNRTSAAPDQDEIKLGSSTPRNLDSSGS
jgi:ribosomal protein S18 acetylase RimI-like enzyme